MSWVVEINSSPEPGSASKIDSDCGEGSSSLLRARAIERMIPAVAGPGPSTAAARARSSRRILKCSSTIIELTDSESDDGGNPVSKRARSFNRHTSLKESLSKIKSPVGTSRALKTGAIDGEADTAKGKEEILPLFLEDDEETEQVIKGPGHASQSLARLTPLENSQERTRVAAAEAIQPRGDAPISEEGDISTDANEGQAAPDAPAPQQGQEQQEGNLDESENEEGIISGYMAQVLEIIPDVAPEYLLALITQLYPQHQKETIDLAIQILFEDGQYPKVERKGKRKSEADVDVRALKKARIEYTDYSQRDRPSLGGPHYANMSLDHLQTAFPYVPKTFVRTIFLQHNNLYAPTHIYFTDLFKRYNQPPNVRPAPSSPDYPFFPRKTPYKPLPMVTLNDAEFEKERAWILAYDKEAGDLVKVRALLSVADDDSTSENDVDPKGKGKAAADDQEDEEQCPEGEGIECNCCFTEYPFEKMIQCPEGHLFCKSCVVAYASNQLGLQDTKLKCMDQSGCSLLYPESELRRVLPEKLIALYDRLKQQKEIAEADLDGLEECPFCDYKCVMEVDKTQEKLFRCRNYEGECGAISCRECKRPDHLPRSCKEMDEDRILNKQHAVEEAMSAALMRTCPKCQKPFIKESGCNKITCYTCHTSSCYICRKIISGYDHFDQTPVNASAPSKSSKKCPLWDSVEARHAQEVKDAAEKAMDDLKSKNPDIDTSAIKVDVPTVKPPPNPPTLAPPAPVPFLGPPAYAPAPGNPGQHLPNPPLRYQYHGALPALPVMAPPVFGQVRPGQNPMGHPPPIAGPWQFPQYVANPLIGNPQVNVQRQPIPAPPAPVAPVRQPRGTNRTGNVQAQKQPKRPAGRARR